MKFYCLTLQEHPHKREVTQAHLEAHGIKAEYFTGFYGMTAGLRAANPYDHDPNGAAKYFHQMQIGCVLSHLACLRAASMAEDLEFVIFEDDVVLLDGFAEKIVELSKSWASQADVVNLAFGDESKPFKELSFGLRRVFFPWGSVATFWTLHGARQAIKLLSPIDRPFDQMLIEKVYPFLPFACTAKPICGHRNDWQSSMRN